MPGRNRGFTAIILSVSLICPVGAEQPIQLVNQSADPNVEQRFASLEAELAELREQLQQPRPLPQTTYAGGFANGCNRPVGGWYGGFELVVVRPQFQNRSDFNSRLAVPTGGGSDGKDGGGGKDGLDGGGTDAADSVGGKDGLDGGGIDAADSGGGKDSVDSGNTDAADGGTDGAAFGSGGTPVPLQPTFGFQATPRLYVGWRNDEGFGFRSRYWLLDAEAEPLVDSRTESSQLFTQSLNLQAVDLEMTQLTCLGGFEIELAGGVRYGHVKIDSTVDPEGVYLPTRLRNNFDGVGPTAAAFIRRPLGYGNWAAVGGVRGSLLFGQSSYNYDAISGNTPVAISTGSAPFNFVPVFETQVGLERSWWRENSRFAIRAMGEAQVWGGVGGGFANTPAGTGTPLFRTDQNLGLIGANISFVYEH